MLPLPPTRPLTESTQLVELARLGKGRFYGEQLSPRGDVLAVGTWIGVYLYSVPDGREVAFLPTHVPVGDGGFFKDWDFTPDGRWLLTPYRDDGTVAIWDVDAAALYMLVEEDSGIKWNWGGEVAASHDSRYFAVARDEVVRIIDIHDKRVWSAPAKEATMVRFVDGTDLLAIVKLSTLKLHDVQSGEPIRTAIEERSIYALSPDGRLCVVHDTSVDQVSLVDVASSKDLFTWDLLDVTDPTYRVEFSSDSRTVGIKGPWLTPVPNLDDDEYEFSRMATYIFDTRTGERLAVYEFLIEFEDEGRWIPEVDEAQARVWLCLPSELHIATRNNIDRARYDATDIIDRIDRVSLSRDGRYLASVADHRVIVTNLATGEDTTSIDTASEDRVTRAGLADNHLIVMTSRHSGITVWNYLTGEVTYTLWEPNRDRMPTHLSTAGSLVAVGLHYDEHDEVGVWNLRTGELIRRLAHADTVREVMLDSAGRHVMTCTKDGVARLWEIDSGMLVHSYACDVTGHHVIALDPTLQLVALWNAKSIVVFDLRRGQRVRELDVGRAGAVAFSPDGRWLVSANFRDVPRVWDIETGEQIHTLSGHVGDVSCVAVSDRFIVTGGADLTIRFWGQPVESP